MIARQPTGSGGPRQPLTSVRRRWLTLLVVVLLIGVPVGYLVVSAQQSRESGKDKQGKAAATGLIYRWPAKVQRRIYDMPIPSYSSQVAYYETNNWNTSKMYVQFVTSATGLDTFLGSIGTSRSALEQGRITISRQEADTVGWRLGPGPQWAGTVRIQPAPQPEQEITVDLHDQTRPMVYVVSTVTP